MAKGIFAAIFGDNKKKIQKENEALKNRVTSLMATMMSQAGSNALITQKLKGLQDALSQQADSDKKEAFELLQKTGACLQKANELIVTGKYSQAGTYLDKSLEFVKQRAAHCGMTVMQVGTNVKVDFGDIEIEESNVEKLTRQLDEAQDAFNLVKEKVEILQKQIAKNPMDFASKAKLQQTNIEFKTIENKMINASNALTKELVRLGRKEEAEQIKENIQNQTVSDAQNDIYKDVISEHAQDVQDDMDDIGSYVNATAPSLGMQNDVSANLNSAFGANVGNSSMASAAFGGTASAPTTFMGMNIGATATYGAGANPYGGGGNNSPLGSKADIARMNSILEQSQEQYDEKLKEASAELSNYDRILRPLLQKRQTASPSECLVLDGKIDQINAKRNKVAHTIKRLRNAIAQLDEQLTLMGRVEFQQDLEAMKGRIQQLTGGKYADIEGLSMYLKDSIAKENAELENLGVSNAVIDSEEINMNSYSGANSSVADMSNVKDEDKYAALERELGLSTY